MAVIDSLIGYWMLDEASGNAVDAHGSNTLTDNNTVAAGTGPSGSDGSRDFESGNSEDFSHTDNAALSTGDIDFSLAVWVQLESNSDYQCAISRWPNEYGVRFYYDLNRFVWYLDPSGTGGYVTANTFGAPSLATWCFIVVWHDSVNNQIAIQVNNGTPDTASFSTGVPDSSDVFRIGSLGGHYWDGLLAKVGFWKKVLTSGERTWLYNSGAGRSYADIVAEAGGGAADVVDPMGMSGVFGQ